MHRSSRELERRIQRLKDAELAIRAELNALRHEWRQLQQWDYFRVHLNTQSGNGIEVPVPSQQELSDFRQGRKYMAIGAYHDRTGAALKLCNAALEKALEIEDKEYSQ